MKSMHMKIEFTISSYEHLPDRSCYNCNYYLLHGYGDSAFIHFPASILQEECHEDENYFDFALGNFDKYGDFVPVLEWSSDYGCNGIEDLFNK